MSDLVRDQFRWSLARSRLGRSADNSSVRLACFEDVGERYCTQAKPTDVLINNQAGDYCHFLLLCKMAIQCILVIHPHRRICAYTVHSPCVI